MPYKALDRMSAADRKDIRAQAEQWRERFGATPL
jgi:hypothetical protein